MSTFKEMLAAALESGSVSDEFNTQALEAYDFDTADYAEQVNTLTGERDTATEASGNAATEVARLAERISELETEIVAVKAMNFDELMNGRSAGESVVIDEEEEEGDSSEDTFEALLESATKAKE